MSWLSEFDNITLIRTTHDYDHHGVSKEIETRRTAIAQVKTVSQSEFFEGGRAGYRPQFQFVMNRYDYDGERDVIYEGNKYHIYRVYLPANSDNVELYAETRKGAE